MRTQKLSAGFTIIEVVIVIVVLGLIGFVGYRVWDASQPSASEQSQQNTANDDTKNTEAEITSNDGLTAADEKLDQTDVDGTFEQDLSDAGTF